MTNEELIERLDRLEVAARVGGCDYCDISDGALAEELRRLSLELRIETLAPAHVAVGGGASKPETPHTEAPGG